MVFEARLFLFQRQNVSNVMSLLPVPDAANNLSPSGVKCSLVVTATQVPDFFEKMAPKPYKLCSSPGLLSLYDRQWMSYLQGYGTRCGDPGADPLDIGPPPLPGLLKKFDG